MPAVKGEPARPGRQPAPRPSGEPERGAFWALEVQCGWNRVGDKARETAGLPTPLSPPPAPCRVSITRSLCEMQSFRPESRIAESEPELSDAGMDAVSLRSTSALGLRAPGASG